MMWYYYILGIAGITVGLTIVYYVLCNKNGLLGNLPSMNSMFFTRNITLNEMTQYQYKIKSLTPVQRKVYNQAVKKKSTSKFSYYTYTDDFDNWVKKQPDEKLNLIREACLIIGNEEKEIKNKPKGMYVVLDVGDKELSKELSGMNHTISEEIYNREKKKFR